MTFEEIVDEVAGRLNLTSDDAIARIGARVNERYRRVTSGIGLITSRRVVTDVTLDPDDVASVLPDVELEDIEKVVRVITTSGSGGIRVLRNETYDDIANVETKTQMPRAWAVKLMDARATTITLDAFPEEEFTITVEGYVNLSTISGIQEPAFPEDYHDILVWGALADEQLKMEKPQLAAVSEINYERRLSDLRFFITRSAYQDIYQGRNSSWNKPWFNQRGLLD
jgi:hypothetical protein